MTTRRILISVAHPDDESFGFGGVIAKYVKEGAEVYIICATDGGAGVVSPEMMNGYNSVAELRLAELDCAASYLGVTRVVKFGYKDSDMLGRPANLDPESLWYNWQTKPDKVIHRVVEVIREIRPHVVITFNQYGGYGHPDHIAMHRATVQAFEKAADSTYLTDDLEPYQAQKLYLNRFPTLMLRIGITMMRLRGKDPRKIGRNKDIDLVAVIEHTQPAHTRVDIRRYMDTWNEASACHASQGGGQRNEGFLMRLLRKMLVPAKHSFTRVYPPPSRDRVDETDLFAGVNLEEQAMELVP